nr:MAG: hypothetical protein 3 [Guangxi cysto-like virus 3]
MQVQLSKASKAISTLTQNGRFLLTDGLPADQTQAVPTPFSQTWAASLTSEYAFKVGEGRMDPVKHARLLYQHAKSTGVSFSELADEYISLLHNVAYEKGLLMRVVAHIVGTGDKSIVAGKVQAVTPTYVVELVLKHISQDHPSIFAYVLGDFICGCLAPLGWIMDDAAYVYKMDRHATFPNYNSLVDQVKAADLIEVLEQLASADLSLLKKTYDSRREVLPSVVTSWIANEVSIALARVQGSFDAEDIVRNVLYAVATTGNPFLPDELKYSRRVVSNERLIGFRSNIALVLAAQDMLRQGFLPDMIHDDETLVNVTLPAFHEAITKLGIYTPRPLTDAVAHYGKSSVTDHMGRPTSIVLYEDWAYRAGASAFTFIRARAQKDSSAAFLSDSPLVSSSLTTAMSSVQSVFNMEDMVKGRLATAAMLPDRDKMDTNGAMLTIGFPSLHTERRLAGIDVGVLLSQGPDAAYAALGAQTAVTERMVEEVAYDYYAALVHLGVARAAVSHVQYTMVNGVADVHVPFLMVEMRTRLTSAIADSPVVHGSVFTTDMVEALAYADDFQPLTTLTDAEFHLKDFQRDVHLWDWHDASASVGFAATYVTTLRAQEYAAHVTEQEILGYSVRPTKVRVFNPSAARAVVGMYIDWLRSDLAFVDSTVTSVDDDLVRASFEGYKMKVGLHLASALIALGSQGMGARMIRVARQRIAREMYAKDAMDDFSSLEVGIQAHQMALWAGLTTLEVLTLIDGSEASFLLDVIKETKALQHAVGMNIV